MKPMSETAISAIGFVMGFFLFVLLMGFLIMELVHHDNIAQQQSTTRLQAKIAACKAAPDIQTCMETVVGGASPNVIMNIAPGVSASTTKQ